MKMNPEEITSIIKDQIKNYAVDLNVDEVGTVIEIGDGIAHIHGLNKAMAGELLDFGNNIYGLVLNLEQDNVVPLFLVVTPRLRRVLRLREPVLSCRFQLVKQWLAV